MARGLEASPIVVACASGQSQRLIGCYVAALSPENYAHACLRGKERSLLAGIWLRCEAMLLRVIRIT
jgi:hypothetical protein